MSGERQPSLPGTYRVRCGWLSHPVGRVLVELALVAAICGCLVMITTARWWQSELAAALPPADTPLLRMSRVDGGVLGRSRGELRLDATGTGQTTAEPSLENVTEAVSLRARRMARTVGGPRESDACRPVEDTEFVQGAARKLRNGWDEHRRALAKATPLRYCIWQCGPDKCCKRGGSVTIDRFPVVRNTLVNKDGDGDDGSDATLVTQGTANRILAFGNISEVWPGPKVVIFAIYNHTAERAEQAASERNAVVAASAAWNNTKTMIFMIEHHPNMDTYSRQITDPMLALYPVNTLRNVVMDSAPTNWVFTLDIDFKPSATLYRNLVDLQLSRLNLVDRTAVVIPHFEILKNKCTDRYPPIPGAFDEMEQHLLAGSVIPFHVEPTVLIPALPVAVGKCFKTDRSKSWPQGIGASNYSRWYYESAQGLGGFIRLTSISMFPDKCNPPRPIHQARARAAAARHVICPCHLAEGSGPRGYHRAVFGIRMMPCDVLQCQFGDFTLTSLLAHSSAKTWSSSGNRSCWSGGSNTRVSGSRWCRGMRKCTLGGTEIRFRS